MANTKSVPKERTPRKPPQAPSPVAPLTPLDRALGDLDHLALQAEAVQALAEALSDVENLYMPARSKQSKGWLMDRLMKQIESDSTSLARDLRVLCRALRGLRGGLGKSA
jgi:hypothetical protein